jgi:environmental stress-induced protein Ves
VLEGETTDLNAMTRRGAFTHSMRRLQSNSRFSITGVADETALIFGGVTVVEAGGEVFRAGRLDALMSFAPGESLTVTPEVGATTHLIEFFRSQAEQKDSKERPETPMS